MCGLECLGYVVVIGWVCGRCEKGVERWFGGLGVGEGGCVVVWCGVISVDVMCGVVLDVWGMDGWVWRGGGGSGEW